MDTNGQTDKRTDRCDVNYYDDDDDVVDDDNDDDVYDDDNDMDDDNDIDDDNDNGCPQKKCLEAIFSIIEITYKGYFFVTKIIDKVLSLSKFWWHLANVKIVKILYIYIQQY